LRGTDSSARCVRSRILREGTQRRRGVTAVGRGVPSGNFMLAKNPVEMPQAELVTFAQIAR